MHRVMALGVVVLVVGLYFWSQSGETPSVAEPRGSNTKTGSAANENEEELQRAALNESKGPNTEEPGRDERQATDPTFEELFERLIETHLEGRQALVRKDQAAVRKSHESVQLLLGQLRETPDSGRKSLDVLVASLGITEGQSERAGVAARRAFASHLIADALAGGMKAHLSGSLDALEANRGLLRAILSHMCLHVDLIRPLGSTLKDRPFLEGLHEGDVLLVADVVAEHPGLHETASDLLFTTWVNTKTAGSLSADYLNTRVRAHRNSDNPAKSLAAWKYLLIHGGPENRELILSQLLEEQRLDCLNKISSSLIATMKPSESLSILKRLVGMAQGQLTGAYFTLGRRDPEIVQKEYKECLSAGTDPAHRAALVCASASSGAETAQFAFEHDGDIHVRINALLIVTGSGADAAEKALLAALDSQSFREGSAISMVVAGLQNMLAHSPGRMQVMRVLNKIGTNTNLSKADRETLRRIRQKDWK
jgi:hypothetical protein